VCVLVHACAIRLIRMVLYLAQVSLWLGWEPPLAHPPLSAMWAVPWCAPPATHTW